MIDWDAEIPAIKKLLQQRWIVRRVADHYGVKYHTMVDVLRSRNISPVIERDWRRRNALR